MEVTALQTIKLLVVSVTGLSRDALHTYTGLTTLFLAALILRKPLKSMIPWLIVLAVGATGEIIDMYDDMILRGYWKVNSSMHDMLNTLFWPTVILLLARFTRLFSHPDRRR
jgi:hypothetical protein